MTYNVFDGTLNLTQSINQSFYRFKIPLSVLLLIGLNPDNGCLVSIVVPKFDNYNAAHCIDIF